MLTWPSMVPSESFMGTSGAVNVPAPLPEPPEPSELPLEVPHAAAPKASTSDTAIVVVSSWGLLVGMPARRCREGRSGGSETNDMHALPGESDLLAAPADRIGGRAAEVLLEDGEPPADVEVHHRVRRGTEVDDLGDDTGGDAAVLVVRERRPGRDGA